MASSTFPDQHFFPERTMPFLEDSNDDDDVEVTKAASNKFFDPVVGGRHSVRSSSSRSSAGSTGFFDNLELSPTSSLSPYAFDQDYDDNSLSQVMTNFQNMTLMPGSGGDTFRSPNLLGGGVHSIGAPGHQASGSNPTGTLAAISYHQYCNQQQQPSINCSSQMIANLAALAQLNSQNNSLWIDPNNTFGNVSSNNLFDKPATMQIRNKFGSLGDAEGQFHSPHGFCMGPNEEIIVADTYNHRIQVFDKDGGFLFAFGVAGKDEGQLWYPRKVAVLRESGHYVICDRGSERSRMQIFSPMGHFIRRIPIRFIDIVAGLAISREGYIVAVDSVTPTIFILNESGDLMRYIECSEYMTEPSDIAIFGHEYFICDFKGHSIVVMHENGTFLRRIGCQPVTNFPNGIDISDEGDILVGDSHGNMFHVAVYDRRGELVAQYQCPQVKVSRCCGLKITSKGHIVTLAKNNHHVLILNTLFVP